MRTIKKGELILLTYGEYSDYNVIALSKAKTDIDIDQMHEMYLSQFPDEQGEDKFKPRRFAEWLEELGVVTSLEYRSFHLGNYGCIDFTLDE